MPPGEQEVRAALSQLRQKLLDLTARNPLISFKHGKSARYIRIVDELPDRLTEELYAGKSLKFSPISEPDATELASWSPGNDCQLNQTAAGGDVGRPLRDHSFP